MKCIILAAGYATRLYPLTKNTPKPLLQIGGRTILDRILEKVEPIEVIDEIVIVSNDKFFSQFRIWAEGYKGKKITVLNDGSTSNENRLGAVRDIHFAINENKIKQDMLVLAGDNLFDFALEDLMDFYLEKQTDCITCHVLQDREKLQRTGVALLDDNNKVLDFAEKPPEPRSNLAVPPFYIYRKETIPLIEEFIKTGNSGDAPGMLIAWLLQKVDIHAFLFTGQRYDIGTLDSYREAQEIFG